MILNRPNTHGTFLRHRLHRWPRNTFITRGIADGQQNHLFTQRMRRLPRQRGQLEAHSTPTTARIASSMSLNDARASNTPTHVACALDHPLSDRNADHRQASIPPSGRQTPHSAFPSGHAIRIWPAMAAGYPRALRLGRQKRVQCRRGGDQLGKLLLALLRLIARHLVVLQRIRHPLDELPELHNDDAIAALISAGATLGLRIQT